MSPHAPIEALAEEIFQYLRQLGDVPQGLLRVSAPVTFGQAYISPILAGYLERYPKVDIELNLNDGQVDFFADRVDVAFRVGDFTNVVYE